MVVDANKPLSAVPRVLIRGREACTVFDRGAFVSIRRAPFEPGQTAELRCAIESVTPEYPLSVMLFAFRLAREFPVAERHLTEFDEFSKFMRAVDKHIAAYAIVLEFGGVRAAAMRVIGRTVLEIARPRGVFAFHERLTEGAAWLVPHAREIGALDDLADYIRCYREADRLLDS